jgi:hypothetical protein
MSLINDALKKAQKQRTGDSPPLAAMPGIGGESAARIAKRAKPAGFNSLLIRLGLGAGGVLVLAAAAWLAVRAFNRPPDIPPAKPTVVTQAAPAPASTPSTFTVPIVVPAAPEPVKVSPPTPSAAGESKPVAAIVAPVEPPPEPAPVKAAPAKLDAKAVVYIENLRIAGIRASATDSKVLMNDRVYRVGDMVEHELGLKLTGITASSLSFEDEHGAKYTRNF